MICETEQCYRRVGGGGSRGRTIADLAVFLSREGANATIAAHELSHVQIHKRIGLVRTLRGDAPEWFVEGVAVVVSDDPRYLAGANAADRCLVEPDGPLPTTLAAWVRNAAREQLFAKAACKVSRWMQAKGGRKAVVALLDQIAEGARSRRPIVRRADARIENERAEGRLASILCRQSRRAPRPTGRSRGRRVAAPGVRDHGWPKEGPRVIKATERMPSATPAPCAQPSFSPKATIATMLMAMS